LLRGLKNDRAGITEVVRCDAVDNHEIIESIGVVHCVSVQFEKQLSPRYVLGPIKGHRLPNRDITDESAKMELTVPASRRRKL